VAQAAGDIFVQVAGNDTDFLDRFEVVVDHQAEPLDLDRFLDALDRLVERRLREQAARLRRLNPVSTKS